MNAPPLYASSFHRSCAVTSPASLPNLRLTPARSSSVRRNASRTLAGDAGWARILVLTGVTATPEGVVPAPDLVVESLADLPGALA